LGRSATGKKRLTEGGKAETNSLSLYNDLK
jgi:hypothetical protein